MRMVGLRDRTKQYALRILKFVKTLPDDSTSRVLKNQLLRSGTSVAANFREASRARSNAEFISKLGIVEQELDEFLLWIELIVESELVPKNKLEMLMQEADELLRIICTTIVKTKQLPKD